MKIAVTARKMREIRSAVAPMAIMLAVSAWKPKAITITNRHESCVCKFNVPACGIPTTQLADLTSVYWFALESVSFFFIFVLFISLGINLYLYVNYLF